MSILLYRNNSLTIDKTELRKTAADNDVKTVYVTLKNETLSEEISSQFDIDNNKVIYSVDDSFFKKLGDGLYIVSLSLSKSSPVIDRLAVYRGNEYKIDIQYKTRGEKMYIHIKSPVSVKEKILYMYVGTKKYVFYFDKMEKNEDKYYVCKKADDVVFELKTYKIPDDIRLDESAKRKNLGLTINKRYIKSE